MPLNLRQKVVLWDVVNEYVAACGGDPSNNTVSPAREVAVVKLERAVELLIGVEKIVSDLTAPPPPGSTDNLPRAVAELFEPPKPRLERDEQGNLVPALPRWVAKVQKIPLQHTFPERLVIEAASEADARQTLEAAGYTRDFLWKIHEVLPEAAPKGRLVNS